MWNRKRCRVYSNMVHAKFPKKKHAIVIVTADVVIDAGKSQGAVHSGTCIPENCTRER